MSCLVDGKPYYRHLFDGWEFREDYDYLPRGLEGFWDSEFFYSTTPISDGCGPGFIKTKNPNRLEERLGISFFDDPQDEPLFVLVHDTRRNKAFPMLINSDVQCGTLGDAWTQPRIFKKRIHLSKHLAVDQTASVYAKLHQVSLGKYPGDDFFPPRNDDDDFSNNEDAGRYFGTAILAVDPMISSPDDPDVLKTLTNAKLKRLCQDNDLQDTGRKSDLINRLLRGSVPTPLSRVV